MAADHSFLRPCRPRRHHHHHPGAINWEKLIRDEGVGSGLPITPSPWGQARAEREGGEAGSAARTASTGRGFCYLLLALRFGFCVGGSREQKGCRVNALREQAGPCASATARLQARFWGCAPGPCAPGNCKAGQLSPTPPKTLQVWAPPEPPASFGGLDPSSSTCLG